MTPFLRLALLPLLAVGLVVSATGCVTNCKNGVCTDTTATQFVGTPVDQHVAWTPGQGITITVPGGNLRSGNTATSITVKPGSGSDILVTFTPFVSDAADNKAAAVQSMNDPAHGGNLVLSSTAGSGTATPANVTVGFSGSHQPSLSATVDIVLPAGFDGPIKANTDSGDVAIAGALHGVSVNSAGVGNIEVDLGAVVSGDTGDIKTGHGDITLKVLTAASLDIQAQSDPGFSDHVVTTSPNPISGAAGWMEVPGGSDTAATFRGNSGSAVPWQLVTGFGAIRVEVQ